MTPESAELVAGRPEIPDVSVLIPAYNAMPYLLRCLDSVVKQTLGTDRMEVVVVNDGSTDGTGQEVDTWDARYPGLFRVVHAEGSGGPATPRNTALDLARGRYVFFLDADDYLGVEALERLLFAADTYGSDVVLGRMRGEGGRGVPESMFKESQPDADLFESRVFWTLAPLKLFRRDVIEQHGLRFPTHFRTCSDQPFTAMAYLRARRITVLADYDYYFAVWRDDGQHVSDSGTVSNRLGAMEWMCELLSREVPDPTKRSHLLHRQFQIDLGLAMRGIAKSPYDEQKAQLTRVATLIRTYLSPEVSRALPPGVRVVYELALRELVDETMRAFEHVEARTPYEISVEGDRVLAHLPYFRDPAVPVPDELYDVTDRTKAHHTLTAFRFSEGSLRVTGTAGFRNVLTAQDVEVVLRSRRDRDQEYAAPASTTADQRFEASVDLLTIADGEPLPDGTWDVHLRVSRASISSMCRLGRNSPGDQLTDPTLSFATAGSSTKWIAKAFRTPAGSIRVDVGGRKNRLRNVFRGWKVAWVGTDLVVTATATMRVEAPFSLDVDNGLGDLRTYPVDTSGPRLSAVVPIAELPEGTWEARLHIGTAADHRRVAIPAQQALAAVRWRKLLRPMAAVPVTPARTLTLRVGNLGVAEVARRALGRRRSTDASGV